MGQIGYLSVNGGHETCWCSGYTGWHKISGTNCFLSAAFLTTLSLLLIKPLFSSILEKYFAGSCSMSLPFLDKLSAQQLRAPIWVYDVIGQKMIWANDSALDLWEASDLDDLCRRDFSTDQSQAVQQTLLGYMERFEQGEYVDAWWEISPKGIKKTGFYPLFRRHDT